MALLQKRNALFLVYFLRNTLFWSLNNSDLRLSRDMRFSTTWDLRPEEPQIIMRIFFLFFPRSETHMLLTWVKTTEILIWCARFF